MDFVEIAICGLIVNYIANILEISRKQSVGDFRSPADLTEQSPADLKNMCYPCSYHHKNWNTD